MSVIKIKSLKYKQKKSRNNCNNYKQTGNKV